MHYYRLSINARAAVMIQLHMSIKYWELLKSLLNLQRNQLEIKPRLMKRKNLKDRHLPGIPRSLRILFLKRLNRNIKSPNKLPSNKLVRKKLEVKGINTARKLNNWWRKDNNRRWLRKKQRFNNKRTKNRWQWAVWKRKRKSKTKTRWSQAEES